MATKEEEHRDDSRQEEAPATGQSDGAHNPVQERADAEHAVPDVKIPGDTTRTEEHRK
jgi:hypothetical protein